MLGLFKKIITENNKTMEKKYVVGLGEALWDYSEKNNVKIEGLEKPVNDISEKEEAPQEEY